MILKISILVILVAIVCAEQVRYDSYSLYKVITQNEEQVKFLNELQTNNDGLQLWKLPSDVGDFASIVTPPEKKEAFLSNMKKRNIYADLMLENIQEAFDAQVLSRRKRDVSGQLYWTNYQTMEDIYEWFNYLTSNYGNIVTQLNVGRTAEGKNITGIRISKGSSNRAFVLQAGEVAADWLSPTVMTYIANQLIHSNDTEIKAAAEDFTWYIFPMLNIDGHQFTQDSVRLWLKNRRPITSNAIGVDLTKNWNSQWGVSGGNHTPIADNFIGLGPFSEPESRAFSNFIMHNIKERLAAFLNFRSFGQRIVIPFAHTNELMYNYNEVVTIARRAMGSLAVRYNTQYLVGNSRSVHGLHNLGATNGRFQYSIYPDIWLSEIDFWHILYGTYVKFLSPIAKYLHRSNIETGDGATGSIIDWVKYRLNPPIVATYLLRDTGAWGYTLPVVQITPTCEETFDSLLAIIREAKFINVL